MGKHDRPWFDRPGFGKVRYMSFASTSRKFDSKTFIAQITSSEKRRSVCPTLVVLLALSVVFFRAAAMGSVSNLTGSLLTRCALTFNFSVSGKHRLYQRSEDRTGLLNRASSPANLLLPPVY